MHYYTYLLYRKYLCYVGTDLDLSDERVLSKFAIVIFSPALRSFGIDDSQQKKPLWSTKGVDRYGARNMTHVFKDFVKRDNVYYHVFINWSEA